MKVHLLSPQKVADLCGLSYHTIWRAVKRGDLKATRLNGRIKIPQWALEEWIDVNMIETPRQEKFALPEIAPPKPPPRGSLDRLRTIELEGAEAA